MFTFLVRLWLAIVCTGLVALALQSLYVMWRDGRRNRQFIAAHYYARLVVSDRVLAGEIRYDDLAGMEEAYQFEKIAYLNS